MRDFSGSENAKWAKQKWAEADHVGETLCGEFRYSALSTGRRRSHEVT